MEPGEHVTQLARLSVSASEASLLMPRSRDAMENEGLHLLVTPLPPLRNYLHDEIKKQDTFAKSPQYD